MHLNENTGPDSAADCSNELMEMEPLGGLITAALSNDVAVGNARALILTATAPHP